MFFIFSLILEILLATAYIFVVGIAVMVAITVIAPFCILAEFALFFADLARPSPPPAS